MKLFHFIWGRAVLLFAVSVKKHPFLSSPPKKSLQVVPFRIAQVLGRGAEQGLMEFCWEKRELPEAARVPRWSFGTRPWPLEWVVFL